FISRYSLDSFTAWDASWNSARLNSTVHEGMQRSPSCSGQPLAARRDEFEGVAVALDVAGVEMAANDQHQPVGKACKQLAPRLDRLAGVGIDGRGPVEMGHLAGVVGDVTGQEAL